MKRFIIFYLSNINILNFSPLRNFKSSEKIEGIPLIQINKKPICKNIS